MSGEKIDPKDPEVAEAQPPNKETAEQTEPTETLEAPDTASTNSDAQVVLAEGAIVELLDIKEGDEKSERHAMKQAVNNYLRAINFIDESINIPKIVEAIRYATNEGAEASDRAISPIPSNIHDRIEALGELAESGEKINVVAVNVGGSNTETTSSEVQNGQITNQRNLGVKSFRGVGEEGVAINCSDHVDYWERTIPVEFLINLVSLVREGESQVAIEVGVAMPTRKDGRIDHMSDKATFESNPLAPANEAELREVGADRSAYPTVAESFSEFLEDHEIHISPELIYTAENDTVGIVLGRHQETKEAFDNGKGIGGVVVGTGFNVCAYGPDGKGFNFEIGHLGFENPCRLDQEASKIAGMELDVESCVSGKILGNTLKLAISKLTREDSELRKKIESLGEGEEGLKALNALIFRVGLDEYLSIPRELHGMSENEEILLQQLCSEFAKRAQWYLFSVLRAVSIKMGESIDFIREGSVVSKNPKLVERFNKYYSSRGVTMINLDDSQPESNSSPSTDGVVLDAAAKAYLAEA